MLVSVTGFGKRGYMKLLKLLSWQLEESLFNAICF